MDEKTLNRIEKLGLKKSDFEPKQTETQTEQKSEMSEILDAILGVMEDE